MPSSPSPGLFRPAFLLQMLAWLLLAGIAFATLSPIGLRPETGAPPNIERALAFAVFGVVLALAYPRRLGLAIGIIALTAIGLELLQVLAVARHARLLDVAFKLFGGGIGLAAGTRLAACCRGASRNFARIDGDPGRNRTSDQ